MPRAAYLRVLVRVTKPTRIRLVLLGPAPSCTIAATLVRRARPGMHEFRITARPNGRRLAPGTYALRVEIPRRTAPATAVEVTKSGLVRRPRAAARRAPRCRPASTVALSSFTRAGGAAPSGSSPTSQPTRQARSGPATSADTAPHSLLPNPIDVVRGHGSSSAVGWLLLGLIAIAIVAPLVAIARRRLAR